MPARTRGSLAEKKWAEKQSIRARFTKSVSSHVLFSPFFFSSNFEPEYGLRYNLREHVFHMCASYIVLARVRLSALKRDVILARVLTTGAYLPRLKVAHILRQQKQLRLQNSCWFFDHISYTDFKYHSRSHRSEKMRSDGRINIREDWVVSNLTAFFIFAENGIEYDKNSCGWCAFLRIYLLPSFFSPDTRNS